MSVYQDRNSDSPTISQNHSDDFAMFELPSSPSTRREEQPIYVDCGDDSDDDSDVIIIDTTPAILAQKFSADCDRTRDEKQEHSKPTKRRRTEVTAKSTTPKVSFNKANEKDNENQTRIPMAKQINNGFSIAAKNMKGIKSTPNYDSVFEGCNSFEPIEIDDDSDEDGGNCNLEDGKSKSGMGGELRRISRNNNPEISMESFTTTESVVTSAETSRKASSSVLEDKKERKNQSDGKEIEKVDDNDLTSLESHTTHLRNGKNSTTVATRTGSFGKANVRESNSTTDSEMETGVSKEDAVQTMEAESDKNASRSPGIHEDSAVSRPAFEVINLADDDDDSINETKEVAPSISRDSHKCIDNQQPRQTNGTEKAEIEIIDVDEIEDIESEAKGTNDTMCTKPRFKPYKNKRTSRSALRHHEEHLPEKVITNDYNFTRNKGNGNEKAQPSSSPKRSVASTENRFIFHPLNGRPEGHHTNCFLGMNIEDAHKEQERLLQQAAHRVRNQRAFHVTSDPIRSTKVARSITFSSVVRDVHLQYPDHFKYRDFYARLGLPRNANESVLKSQYKRLARVYHPDRNIGKPDTKHKFQAITEAYNHLMNAE